MIATHLYPVYSRLPPNLVGYVRFEPVLSDLCTIATQSLCLCEITNHLYPAFTRWPHNFFVFVRLSLSRIRSPLWARE